MSDAALGLTVLVVVLAALAAALVADLRGRTGRGPQVSEEELRRRRGRDGARLPVHGPTDLGSDGL